MNWVERYSPPDNTIWQGRQNLPPHAYFFQHMRLLNLADKQPKYTALPSFALLGFENIKNNPGTQAIRHALARLPLQKASIHCYDAGNITCLDQDLNASQAALAEVIAQLLTARFIPIVIGGGHELAFGHYQGIKPFCTAPKRLGIVNFDAHFDLYKPSAHASAKTAFYQIAESHRQEKRHFDYNCIGIQHVGNTRHFFTVAKQLKTKIILADELHQGLWEKCYDFIDRIIDENDLIYMSLSLDVFSPAFAPGVSCIQPLGLTPWQVIPLIRQLAASGKTISYDIAEYLPEHDVDQRTATLAAMLIDEIIHHHRAPSHPR